MALLPLVSCSESGTAASLPTPGKRIPQDDGTVFQPDGPRLDDGDSRDGGGEGNENGPDNDPHEAGERDPGRPNSPVPEPTTLLLFGSGLAGVVVWRRSRRKREEEAAEE